MIANLLRAGAARPGSGSFTGLAAARQRGREDVARVYKKGEGLVRIRDSRNGFNCFVARTNIQAFKFEWS